MFKYLIVVQNIETTKQGADSNIQELLEKKDTKGLSNLIKENISDYKNSEMFKNYLKFVALALTILQEI